MDVDSDAGTKPYDDTGCKPMESEDSHVYQVPLIPLVIVVLFCYSFENM